MRQLPVSVAGLLDAVIASGTSVMIGPLGLSRQAEYIQRDGRGVMILSAGLCTSAKRVRCYVAHEWGHVMTGRIGTSPDDERAADEYAARVLLGDAYMASRRHWSVEDIADEADVFERYVRLRREMLPLEMGN